MYQEKVVTLQCKSDFLCRKLLYTASRWAKTCSRRSSQLKLSQMGNPLEKLSSLVDFEMFRPALEDALGQEGSQDSVKALSAD